MKRFLKLTLLVTVAGLIGCSESGEEPAKQAGTNEPTGKQYLLAAEPAGATQITAARESAKDGDTLTLIGHIGGSAKPFIDDLAAFTIVDTNESYCHPDEGCPTPWDYCCTPELSSKLATIKIVNEDGQPVASGARELLGVKELSLVVVTGKAQRDESGNLSLLANKVFVKE